MSKELEEAKREYRTLKRNRNIIAKIEPDYFFEFADTILNHIENSIPKEVIEKKLKSIDYRTANSEEMYYKKEILQELLEKK